MRFCSDYDEPVIEFVYSDPPLDSHLLDTGIIYGVENGESTQALTIHPGFGHQRNCLVNDDM